MFHTLFLVFFGNGSHFRAESQEESHIDVIGYLTRTSDDVVGDKCWTVMFKCQSHKCFRTKTCFFICNNKLRGYRTFIFNQAVGDPESSGITVQVK